MAKEIDMKQTEEIIKGTGYSYNSSEMTIDPLESKKLNTKSMLLDRIQESMDNGSNIDHCLTLSQIYKNLCN